jgi:hypothetical protein
MARKIVYVYAADTFAILYTILKADKVWTSHTHLWCIATVPIQWTVSQELVDSLLTTVHAIWAVKDLNSVWKG